MVGVTCVLRINISFISVILIGLSSILELDLEMVTVRIMHTIQVRILNYDIFNETG